MRILVGLCLLNAVFCGPALADDYCDVYRHPACCYPDSCACPSCCPPPPVECDREGEPELGRRGVYVRAPETGEYAGESESVGLRGLGIRIPEFHLELPTIQLPCFIHFRRDAELYADSARLPFVEREPVEFGQFMKREPEAAPRPREPESAPLKRDCCPPQQQYLAPPPAPAACASNAERELRWQLQVREYELSQLQNRFEQLESAVNSLAERPDPVQLADNEVANTAPKRPQQQYRSHSYTKAVGHEQTVRPHTGNSHSHNVRAAHHHHHHAPAARPKPSRTLEFLGALRPSFDWIGSDD